MNLIEFPNGKYGIRRGEGQHARYLSFYGSGGWYFRRYKTGEVRSYCMTSKEEAEKVFRKINPDFEKVIK